MTLCGQVDLVIIQIPKHLLFFLMYGALFTMESTLKPQVLHMIFLVTKHRYILYFQIFLLEIYLS